MSEDAPMVVLDVSALPAPEPFQRITEALSRLPDSACLKVLHRREPFPLYPVLRSTGFVYRVEHDPGGQGPAVVILIRRAPA